MKPVTASDLQEWLVKAQEVVRVGFTRDGSEWSKNNVPILSIDEGGKKYARIVKDANGPHRSVYCFVNLENGDILKAASWKAPAKHARGNIFADDPVAGLGTYGAAYLK